MTLVALSGCGIQSKIIEARHWELNDTIRTTTDEQLLLNIVRLRYDEVPYLLQMASVTTSFSAGAIPAPARRSWPGPTEPWLVRPGSSLKGRWAHSSYRRILCCDDVDTFKHSMRRGCG